LQAWQQIFIPNLSDYVVDLAAITTSNLISAHELLRAFGLASSRYDPFGFHRQSIETNPQNGEPEIIDVLIDAAREISIHLLQTDPPRGIHQSVEWFASDVPILQRLAIIGFAKRSDLSSDQKLQWLIENHLIHRFKTDVFWFIQESYPFASSDVRKSFIENALIQWRDEDCGSVSDDSRKYIWFNFLVWLCRVKPDCPSARKALEEVQKENPGFVERDSPELQHWTSGPMFVDPTAGFDIGQIVAKEAGEFLDELLAAKQSPDPIRKDRSRYCSAVTAAAERDPGWGLSFAHVLLLRDLREIDLWRAVCYGWSAAKLSQEDWQLLLDFGETADCPAIFYEEFVTVLQHGVRNEKYQIPFALLEKAQIVAERVWMHALDLQPEEGGEGEADRFFHAINNAGGKITEFWIMSIAVIRDSAGDSWKGLSYSVKANLARILASSSRAAGYARTIFASRFDYFYSIDPSFAKERMTPLFDWRMNEQVAEQSWKGFLHGRWTAELLPELLSFFTETIAIINRFSKEDQNRLVGHIATLALYLIADPFANNWLPNICQSLTQENYVEFGWAIDRFLDGMDTLRAEIQWQTWLLKYWNLRRTGKPKPLSLEEADALTCWALSVGKHFPVAVETIKVTKIAAKFGRTGFIYRIQKKELAKAYPEETAQLVLHCLKHGSDQNRLLGRLQELWTDLHQQGISSEVSDAIRNEALRLGLDLER
jgi:Domain of unknown function (DUF4020)